MIDLKRLAICLALSGCAAAYDHTPKDQDYVMPEDFTVRMVSVAPEEFRELCANLLCGCIREVGTDTFVAYIDTTCDREWVAIAEFTHAVYGPGDF